MGTENFTFGPGSIYIMNQDGDVGLEAPTWGMTCDVPLSGDAEIDYSYEVKVALVQEFAGSGYIVNYDLLNSHAGHPGVFYIEYLADIQVQARRHRKKRIDKKWLKRYGYKTVRRKIRLKCDQLTMTPDDDGLGVRFDVEGVKVCC